MAKLVCESLNEFNLIKEAGDREGGAIVGAAKNIGYAATALPGQALRWVRAKAIIKKYQAVIPKRIEKTFEKYLPNIKELVKNTQARKDTVEKSGADEDVKKNQYQDILKDTVDHMQEVLKSIKDAMEGQLKVYADNIGDRLERTGTLTNVKFSAQQKRSLLTMWRGVEDEAHKLMQEKFIKLINDPQLSQFQYLKAELEAYIEKIRYNRHDFDFGEDSDETVLKAGSDDEKLYNYIINTVRTQGENIELDKAYKIEHSKQWDSNILGARDADYVGFKIDNTKSKMGYAFYDFIKPRTGKGRLIRSQKSPNLKYFIDETRNETFDNGKDRFDAIFLTIKV
jgi:hypothetical protein